MLHVFAALYSCLNDTRQCMQLHVLQLRPCMQLLLQIDLRLLRALALKVCHLGDVGSLSQWCCILSDKLWKQGTVLQSATLCKPAGQTPCRGCP
jgi:hypothetical protein